MHLRFTLAAGLCISGLAAAQGSSGPSLLLINELRIDQSSADDDEYVELFSIPSNASLDGITYLVIGDGTTGNGTLEAVVDLTGSATNGQGLFLAAESTFTLATADLTTTLDFENSDNVTHLIVSGFTGALGDDLDTDDDGVLDSTPWTTVFDAISLVEDPMGGDAFYATQLGGIDVGPDGTFVPAHVLRCLTSLTDVRIGEFAPLGVTDTPGAFNENCTASTEVFCDPGVANEVSPSGGTIELDGSGSIQVNDSTLIASSVPDYFGVFVQSDTQAAPMMTPIGGNICVNGNTVRMNRIVMAVGNQATLPLDFSDSTLAESAVGAGETFYYQFFHRDTATGLGGNYTNGIAITWAP